MSLELIPVEIDLTQSSVYTIWAPHWREEDEEWEAFLGKDNKIIAFETPGKLWDFCQTDKSNDLREHPNWLEFIKNPATKFKPRAGIYPLVDVMGIFAQKPSISNIANLNDIFTVIKSIGEVCSVRKIENFFLTNPIFSELNTYADQLCSSEGKKTWFGLQKIILKNYDELLDEVEKAVDIKDRNTVKSKQADELISKAEATEIDETTKTEPKSDKINDEFKNSIWSESGIDPILIKFADSQFFTLRCYLDDKPVFLGNKNKIYGFETKEELVDFIIATPQKYINHSMKSISSIPDLQKEKNLKVLIIPDNTYDFTDLTFEISRGPKMVDSGKLALAFELLNDTAQYTDDLNYETILGPTSPLGWFVDYAVKHKNKGYNMGEPPPPYDHEVSQWESSQNDLKNKILKI